MTIDPQFFMTLQGRPFVTFAGLLDGAHRAGLRSVVTTLVQIPAAENGSLAVMRARVEMENGQVYEAIGDASPESVGRMIAPHLLRMAETRAVGRALRWALNVGAAMREELGDAEPLPEEPHRPAAPAAPVNGNGRGADNRCEGCGGTVTPARAAFSRQHHHAVLCLDCRPVRTATLQRR